MIFYALFVGIEGLASLYLYIRKSLEAVYHNLYQITIACYNPVSSITRDA